MAITGTLIIAVTIVGCSTILSLEIFLKILRFSTALKILKKTT